MCYKLKIRGRMLRSAKGQATIELLIYFAAGLTLMVMISAAIVVNTTNRVDQREQELTRSVVDDVFNEVLLASIVSDGYERDFELPDKIGSKEYNMVILNESVILVSTDIYESSKIIFTTTGQPIQGMNTIRKENGEISIN